MHSRPGAADSRFGARPTGANSFRLRSDENRRPNFGRGEPSPGSADVDMKDASPATPATSSRFQRATPTSAASTAAASAIGNNRQVLRERTTASYRSTTAMYLVLKYAGGGDLYKKMRSMPGRRFSERQAMLYTAQLVSALEACHNQHVIHRDIKPENILLSDEGTIQLADFGWSSANVTAASRRDTLCGTLDYLSPEMIRGEKYDESVDIWAVGIIMYELLVGKPPFEAPGQNETIELITEGQLRVPPMVSLAAKDLIMRILQKLPEKRLSLTEIKAHRWFAPLALRQRSTRRGGF
ncbi:hypothetical protein PHYPSEUDO_003132 [Phytophthora pseudosyringae]|uniref:Protein kinase domain-containing protein n=1 Tax=Phytophthora pseudosyringae TaxID=221518 RepID=A0A8T1WEW0_9STRA|nr:hypothetical protein PHYPSEUDO_003132 [Phytophthora pseudosyringae]